MKTLICLLTLIFIGKIVMSQDTIIKTDGSRLVTVVTEVETSLIKYKKYENRQTSPVYSIPKDQVSMIKYADGSKDVFNDSLPKNINHNNRYDDRTIEVNINKTQNTDNNNQNKPNDKLIKTNNSVAGTRYLYFGVRTSLSNKYNGGGFDSYWTNQFTYSTDGGVQLDEGAPSFKSIFVGFSTMLTSHDILNVEIQTEFALSHPLYNTAVFIDGSNGDMYFNLMNMNIAGQYLRGIDVNNKYQVGGELGLDLGLITGSELDNVYLSLASSTLTNISRTYSGSGFGGHFAAVGKMFFGVKKTFGLELRAGYRYLKTTANTTYSYLYTTGSSTFSSKAQSIDLDWSGAFVTAGIIIQIKKPPSRK